MLKVRQVNENPVSAKDIWLNTYEIECSSCHELKWPSLPSKPTSYVCRLCVSRGSKVHERSQRSKEFWSRKKSRVTKNQ